MLILDAAKRDVCLARRSDTATPLQALLMLNDPQFLEASRALAERTLAETDSVEAAIAQAFLRLAGRLPTDGERATLLVLHAEEREAFASDPAAAAALSAIGEASRRDGLADHEVAAMTILCSAIMNTDAATIRR